MSLLDRSLWPVLMLLLATVALFEVTDLDLIVQDHFYDAVHSRWMVDARAPGPRAAFYTAPKAGLIALGIAALTLALGPRRWRERLGFGDRQALRGLWIVFLTLASGPALIGLGKDVTNVFCPSEIRRYGGEIPYVKVLSRFPAEDTPARRGRGFPAGHCSGGFALLSLAGIARSRRGVAFGIGIGLAAGWTMGVYQMLKGAHFLSHTLVTMFVLWLVFLVWRRVLRVGSMERSSADSARLRGACPDGAGMVPLFDGKFRSLS